MLAPTGDQGPAPLHADREAPVAAVVAVVEARPAAPGPEAQAQGSKVSQGGGNVLVKVHGRRRGERNGEREGEVGGGGG